MARHVKTDTFIAKLDTLFNAGLDELCFSICVPGLGNYAEKAQAAGFNAHADPDNDFADLVVFYWPGDSWGPEAQLPEDEVDSPATDLPPQE